MEFLGKKEGFFERVNCTHLEVFEDKEAKENLNNSIQSGKVQLNTNLDNTKFGQHKFRESSLSVSTLFFSEIPNGWRIFTIPFGKCPLVNSPTFSLLISQIDYCFQILKINKHTLVKLYFVFIFF